MVITIHHRSLWWPVLDFPFKKIWFQLTNERDWNVDYMYSHQSKHVQPIVYNQCNDIKNERKLECIFYGILTSRIWSNTRMAERFQYQKSFSHKHYQAFTTSDPHFSFNEIKWITVDMYAFILEFVLFFERFGVVKWRIMGIINSV